MREPKKYVGLHAHSTFSIGDAIGLPQEHMKFALKNGSDALALTDHGNMNGVSHQQIEVSKLRKKGVNFKAIPGVESYFIESLNDWSRLHQENRRLKAEAKALEKAEKVSKKKKKGTFDDELESIGDEMAQTVQEISGKAGDSDEDEVSGTIVENEEESKKFKNLDPLNRRNHLVLLPKNSIGLKSLFQIVSSSYKDGMYNYPRVDFESLAKHSNGNIIALSACLAGVPSRLIQENLAQNGHESLVDCGPDAKHDFELVQGHMAAMVNRFLETLGPENYFLEVQFNKLPLQHLLNVHILECARRTGVKVVATSDSHYSNPDHWREREIYKAMAWASKSKKDVDITKLPEKIEQLKCELYPKNAEQMWQSAKETIEPWRDYYKNTDLLVDAIELSHSIAHDFIGDVQIDKTVKLPRLEKIVFSDKEHLEAMMNEKGGDIEAVAMKELVTLAISGLKARKKGDSDEYIKRLRYELETIKQLKFARYFLTYAKIMQVVSEHMLIGNARGSAGGSLLSYVLNITQMDPIRFGLLFERFLTKKKTSFPDIDSDFSDRDKAVKLLIEYFGEENVIPVSNFVQLKLSSLIKDVSRLHNLPFAEINAITPRVKNEVLSVKKTEEGFDMGTFVLTYEDATVYSPTFIKFLEEHPEVKNTIMILFQQMRNISRHAGGVIVTSDSDKGMPLIINGGELQTPWPEGVSYRHLEEFGLLKFDILGLGTLRVFEDTIRKIIYKKTGSVPSFNEIKNWFHENLHPDNNGLDDQHVYKNIFHQGKYTGIFQFVQENTQRFMQKMKPTSILDISIATSIFRPGPLSLGVDKKFLENRANPDKVKFRHPLLKEVFAETSGLLIFQEQLQMIYHKLAGIPLEDTDSVRKAFTKKDISNKEKAAEDRLKLRNEFVRLTKETNNIKEEDSTAIFDEMEKLVAYSFNKSHAVAYAITSYQAAWFLTYYPEEWITSYIDYCTLSKGKVTGKEDPKAIAIKEAKALGYSISKADINYSDYEFTVNPKNNKELIPGFASLKYVGDTAMEEIKKNRPYNKPSDLLIDSKQQWKHSKFNKRALATLISLEALDSMDMVGKGKLFANYKEVYEVFVENFDKLKRATTTVRDRGKFDIIFNEIVEKVKAKNLEDWTRKEKIDLQKTLAGSVDFNLLMPIEAHNELERINCESIDNWSEKGLYWAILNTATVATTKNGKQYLKLRIYAESNKEMTCMIWGWNASKKLEVESGDIIIGEFDCNEYGFSTFASKFFKLKV